MPPRPTPSIPPEAEMIAAFLADLDAAGVSGVPASRLAKGPAVLKQARIGALQRLERGGLAVQHRAGKKVLWFAARHAPCVEHAMTWLREKGVARGGVAWKATDLKKLLPPVLRPFCMEAAASLVEAGEMWELRAAAGQGRFWVFARAVHIRTPSPAVVAQPAVPVPEREDAASTQRLLVVGPAVHAAYGKWRQASGSSLMAISELQQAANVPLRALHDWLLEEAKAHRAELSEGDWSLASPDVREAALHAQGMKFIRVRLHESG